MIYLFTGEGGGKTIAALGLALRSVGQKRKVVMIQFLKGRKDTGEFKIAQKLKPYLKVFQFGRPGFVNLRDPDEADKALARKMAPEKYVIAFRKKAPKSVDVVLTGRHASTRLYKIADGVSVVKKVK